MVEFTKDDLPTDVVIRLKQAIADKTLGEVKMCPDTFAPYYEFEGYNLKLSATKNPGVV